MTLHDFIFGVYPYLAGTVFILGSWIRFDREQYTWKADSSQLLSNKGMWLGSNLFHVGILGIFFGHAAGMLLPHSWWQMVATDVQHQYIAIYAGALFGGMALVGAAILVNRRMTNARVKAVSRKRDNFVIIWLLATAALGLNTIPGSLHHAAEGDVTTMLVLADYVKSIATLSVDPSLIAGVSGAYKIHMFFGMTIFLVFPFTRLVHVWSVPLTYLGRAYQIVRAKKVMMN
ncbi:MAG: respiratory nitrate reductase subunit gamma [Gammaproteobacteria bacterium]|uniref:nitrate reductase (quinone) n=1 Tax=Candidatus Thiopontia autotrophica TaxID=2841688 RepID=A0A8J6PBU3_9GAMM|nr:respiratory nitrate reductase subunit gamma [Candidatus Thiopontia autotrophica]